MNMHNSGVPGGYIGLGDAYEKVFRQLERADELAAAIAPDKWQLASDSPKSHADQLALTAYDDARDRVADTMGQAIVDSELDVYYTDPKTGSPMLCVDRDVFARHASAVPGFGLTNYVDSNGRPVPEPALRHGFIVYLASKQFKKWLAKIVSSNRTRPVSPRDLLSAYLEHVNQITPAGHSSLSDDRAAMHKQFPGASITRSRVEALRRKHAPKEWSAPGTRKGTRG